MRAFAHSIVETIWHPLLVLDERLCVADANVSFFRTFAVDAGATVGRDVFEIAGGQWGTPRLRTLLETVLSENEPFAAFAVECDIPTLGRQTLLLNACRMSRGEGDAAPMILLAVEVDTVSRRARDELRKANAELELRVAERTAELVAANRELRATNLELEAFCFSISHDLRAPLRALDGFSQELLLTYADKLDEQGRHYLQRIRAGTQRMGQLIDDLLKLSRVTRAEMQREPVDLTALAESVFAGLRERDPTRQISFTARPGLTAACDPRLLRILFENLLENAWKFTAKNPSAAVTFDSAEVAGRPGFVVRDDGAGFDMAYADKLFGAFQRLHSDREFPGTGIGLATVQRIVRRHGGEVRAEGAVGRGAAFYFTLSDPGTAA